MSDHLTDIICRCEQERDLFRRHALPSSPGCLELFRRAFAGNQDAWTALWRIFEPQMRAQIPRQDLVESDVVLQEAMVKFVRKVPDCPALRTTDELGFIIAFLNRAIKWAFLEQYRAARKVYPHDSLEDHPDVTSDLSPASVADHVEDQLLLEHLMQRGQALFVSSIEQVVFQAFFVCSFKPRDILAAHPNLFADIHQVNNVVKRVRRRLLNDVAIRNLMDQPSDVSRSRRQKIDTTAFLEISIQPELQSETPMDVPCPFDEDLLLDYLLESAADDVRVHIERSPHCVRAVQRLREELTSLQHLFYRHTCPDEETLLAYQEQRIQGTEFLVLRKHIVNCPLCQQELTLLAEMDTLAQASTMPRRLRRVIEALFQPPLELALKGSQLLHYQIPDAPHLIIHLRVSTRVVRGKPRTWTLRGELRSHEGQKVGNLLLAASLRRPEHPEQIDYLADLHTDSVFVLSGVAAGTFRLHLTLEPYDIVIPQIIIGDD